MQKSLRLLLGAFLVGMFLVSFNQNIAHIGGGFEASKMEFNNSDSSYTASAKSIIPYSTIPCDEDYKIWDTRNIHVYKFRAAKMRDTLDMIMGYDHCDFHVPRQGYVTSGFGNREGGYHYGIDIKLNTGSEVVSAFEGMVRISQYSSSYGNVVVIRHNNGLETLYAHLSKRKVKPGDFVQAGELIGLGGNTGRSSGAHLHFETRYKGEPINPSKIIDFKNGELKNDTIFLTRYNFKSSKNKLKKKKPKKKVTQSVAKMIVKPSEKVAKPAPKKTVTKKASPKKSVSSTKKYHKVVYGNTLYSLARTNGVSVSQIQKWNKLKGNSIKIGSRIRVK